jgi:predicted enzyme related to lactoylglutathione lyase
MNVKTSLGRIVILVHDYDKAFAFYQQNFACTKIFDSMSPTGQRFLHISFSQDDDIGVWFLKAEGPEQEAAVGKQTAGQPTLVIYTQKIEVLFQHVQQNGVTLVGTLVSSETSKFFHCLDLYGNRLTVVELLT